MSLGKVGRLEVWLMMRDFIFLECCSSCSVGLKRFLRGIWMV